MIEGRVAVCRVCVSLCHLHQADEAAAEAVRILSLELFESDVWSWRLFSVFKHVQKISNVALADLRMLYCWMSIKLSSFSNCSQHVVFVCQVGSRV